jgi:hypothetical protein
MVVRHEYWLTSWSLVSAVGTPDIQTGRPVGMFVAGVGAPDTPIGAKYVPYQGDVARQHTLDHVDKNHLVRGIDPKPCSRWAALCSRQSRTKNDQYRRTLDEPEGRSCDGATWRLPADIPFFHVSQVLRHPRAGTATPRSPRCPSALRGPATVSRRHDRNPGRRNDQDRFCICRRNAQPQDYTRTRQSDLPSLRRAWRLSSRRRTARTPPEG